MSQNSGIGVYLRNILSNWLACSETEVGRLALSSESSRHHSQGLGWHLQLLNPGCAIYTVREQLLVPKCVPPMAKALWVPHYNIPLMCSKPIVATVHDVFHLAMPELVPGLAKRGYARVMFAGVRARARRIICVSEFSKQELMRHVDVPEHRIRVIHNGVAPEWFSAKPSAEASTAAPYFICVGNVKPHKNLSTLIEAFSMLSDLPHRLVIVGRKEGFIVGDPAVARAAQALGDRVQFTGQISQERLLPLVAGASALVLPSLYEGFGLPAIEAMACGCPVVTSRAASLPEICGHAAVYFDPRSPRELASAIRNLAQNVDLQRRLRAEGRERASVFRWDICAQRTAEVIAEVLDG